MQEVEEDGETASDQAAGPDDRAGGGEPADDAACVG